MGQTDPILRDCATEERLSSRGTFFAKFVFPVVWTGGALCWFVGVAFGSGVKGAGGPSIPTGCLALVLAGAALWTCFIPYHFPLKNVTLTPSGLRVNNFWQTILVPYEAVVRVTQKTEINFRYIVVELAEETCFGRRFTFLPNNPRQPWPFGRRGLEDDVVIALRERVDAARKGGRKSGFASDSTGRSVMADVELDGPYY